MLDSLISQKTKEWFAREDCPARPLLEHMVKCGFLRDAQLEAIKTYLFLKIEGGNRPLWELFCDGFFANGRDLTKLHVSEQTRQILQSDSAARALYEFASTGTNGTYRLPELEAYIRDHVSELDCQDIIKRMFYGVPYPDYLFSLPMGAGKTYLMAAFIYLDLYFAQNEPDNPVWAHNFILLVPSGLKSSIMPSLKTIENFDATWVLPEPAASDVKRLIHFDVLDQPKSAKKSNKARNPNAVKLSSHQPFEDLMGLVMVTNAEKVILEKARFTDTGVLIEESDDETEKLANELRSLVGKVPNLQILIDEVHHAATDEIKLRRVVNKWSAGGRLNGVLGFSGTPYLSSAENVKVADGVNLKFSQINSTVFYYPLTTAIETFLKKPTVRTVTKIDSHGIVRRGVEEFRDLFGGLTYSHGETAKLAIYCGTIERLEEQIYPLLLEMGIGADEILKFHKGNKQHHAPAESEKEFRILDQPVSQKRFILLVQIGKEGWDCRTLTGVILSQRGDCPTNMVLQTSCRCLRQMDGGMEHAGIWLNADNAATLDSQLKKEQHTSIEEINKIGAAAPVPMRQRVSRMERLDLPPLEFYQMRVQYDTLVSEPAAPDKTIAALEPQDFRATAEQITGGLWKNDEVTRRFLQDEKGEPAEFNSWLLSISKGSFGSISLPDLRAFEIDLQKVFEAITFDDGGVRRFNALFDADEIAARIRLAFRDRKVIKTKQDVIPKDARLLIVEKLADIAADTKNLYPSQTDSDQILQLDADGKTADEFEETRRAEYERGMEILKQSGTDTGLFALPPASLTASVRNKDRTLHYLPYSFESEFEVKLLEQALELASLRDRGLEIYFNGQGELTEFRIECFVKTTHGWSRVGIYSPDFLVIDRKDTDIRRALIVEAKGVGYAKDFKPRRDFVQNEWLRINNEKFGYRRFEYLYLEGKMDETARYALETKVQEFFTS